MNSKNILITGCSSGIGLDAAINLHKRGYKVFATARKASDVERLKKQGLIKALQLDLADNKSIDAALSKVLSQTGGRLEYLFNNGAYGQPGAIEDLPTDALRQQFETNVFGWHHLIRQVIPVMREQGFGRIVQNSSVLGFVCMPYRGAYNASKYAIEGLTDTLRLELKKTNIKVSLLEPGPINTKFRINAAIQFKQNIDWQNSVHFENYQSQLSRLESVETSTQFTLESEAVTRQLIHALEAKKPKLRYRITFPTRLFALLKRCLPASWLDNILAKA